MDNFFSPLPRALAHRGDSRNYPENTAPAFQAAIDLGVDVVETDVHLSADGEVVIWHDESMVSLTGDPRKIRELTVKELKTIDAGACFSSDNGKTYPFREKGIRPQLLKECLEQFPGVRFNIDLKDKSAELAEKCAAIIKSNNAENRICMASFHHKPLKIFRNCLPGMETSLSQREIVMTLLFHRTGWKPRSVRKGQCRVIQIPETHRGIRILSPGLIRWCRKNAMVIQIWTVNDPGEMDRLFQMGVDGIFSDFAEEIIKAARRSDLKT